MKSILRYIVPILFTVFSFSSIAIGAPVLPKVKLTTSLGVIVIELDDQKAPNSATNFLAYVNDGFYDGTIFHRVIENFMIQGGGFTEEFEQKQPNEAITNEANNGLSNVRGSVAMARTGEPHSATAQFFINTVDNDYLDFTSETNAGWGYAVFGKVVEGMDVVDNIRKVDTATNGMHQNVPTQNITIISATVVEE